MARISACVITKNEEESLPAWLDSMGRIADEMVVADTGSRDGTVALAAAAGAKVVSFPWADDFAAAKNFALDQASGDWIVFLDADEYLSPEDCPKVRAAIEKYDANPKIAGLVLYRKNIDKDTGRDLGSSCYLVRCFRRCSWLRYEGRIHESLQNLSGRGLRIMQYVSGITIYHTGYSGALMPQKLQRNIDLIRKMQEQDGEKDIDFFHLADCWYGLQDYEKAIACCREAIARDVRPGGMENRPYTLLIHSLMLAHHPAEEIEAALSEAARRYPRAAEFLMLWGLFDWDRRDYEAAERHFRESLRLYDEERQSFARGAMTAGHAINFLPAVQSRLKEIESWKERRRAGAQEGESKAMVRISACVIARNEEENLPVWLDSMKRIADEMVVVDTGSEDATASLAAAAGAKVYSFPWADDFASAKNFALDQAEGDWILFLDADEHVPPGDCPKVRAAVERHHANPEVAGLAFRLVNVDKDTGQDLGSSFWQIRCFRRCGWLRYAGRVHETLRDLSGGKRKIMQQVPGISILHTGYSEGLVRQKLRRNIALLEKMQAEEGETPMDAFHFADCYYGLQDYEAAIPYARQAIAQDVRPAGLETRPHTILIQSLMLARHPAAEIESALSAAAGSHPQAPEIFMLWGLFDWDRRDYGAAERHFRESLRLYHSPQQSDEQRALVESHCVHFLPGVYLHLGEIAHWKKHPQEAADCLAESLKLQRRNPHGLKLLCRLMEQSPPADAICLLNSLYDREADREFLTEVLRETRLEQPLLYYEGDGRMDAFRRFLCAGNLPAAAGALVDSAENLYDLGSCPAIGDGEGALAVLLPEAYRRAAEESALNGRLERRIRRKWERLECYVGEADALDGKG